MQQLLIPNLMRTDYNYMTNHYSMNICASKITGQPQLPRY